VFPEAFVVNTTENIREGSEGLPGPSGLPGLVTRSRDGARWYRPESLTELLELKRSGQLRREDEQQEGEGSEMRLVAGGHSHPEG